MERRAVNQIAEMLAILDRRREIYSCRFLQHGLGREAARRTHHTTARMAARAASCRDPAPVSRSAPSPEWDAA
jgi:hypothetical protein